MASDIAKLKADEQERFWPRALVEFKMNPWNLDAGIERLARMVKETGCRFGWSIASWGDVGREYAQALHVAKRHQNVASQAFSIPIGSGGSAATPERLGEKGGRGSDPRLLGLTIGRLLDGTSGERPRASRLVRARRLGLQESPA